MYKCDKCFEVFENPIMGVVNNGTDENPYIENEFYCPFCGDDKYAKCYQCECCYEYFTENICDKICKKCETKQNQWQNVKATINECLKSLNLQI